MQTIPTFVAGVGVGASLIVLIIALGVALRAMDRDTSPRAVTTEPDPIESYPPERKQVLRAPLTPGLWIHHPGEMPVPLNPLGQSEADVSLRS